MGSAEYFNLIKTIRLDLLDIIGSGYVIEHCVSTFLELKSIKIYQNYIADCLNNINEILAKTYSGKYVTARYSELINSTSKTSEKSGDEIALDIVKRAGLKFAEGNEKK